MDHSRVKEQIKDLPSTFTRTGPNFNAFQNSLAVGMISMTDQLSSLQSQLDLNKAQSSWLDIWGALFNVRRNGSEDDASYQTRIKATLLSWGSTVAGIGKFLEDVYGINVTITEDMTASTFQIKFTQPLTTGQLDSIAKNLSAIRPAGIPFLPFDMVTSGPFLTTSLFSGMTQMAGSYLTGGTSGYQPTLSPSTPSVLSKLPTSLLEFSDLAVI